MKRSEREARARASTKPVTVAAGVLQTLVDSVDAFWNDHSFAKAPDNRSWIEDETAMQRARAALKAKR